jgi:hypothetical protein
MMDDEPITLKEACEMLLGGRVQISTLRAEAARGRLVIFRLGRRDFTTALEIRDMVRKCQDVGRRRASTSTQSESSGLSEMDQVSSAQAALSQTVAALKSSSVVTLARNINRSAGRTR